MKTEYRLIMKIEELEGTCYFEFLPGIYQNKCWNKQSVYLNEDSLAFFENYLHDISSTYGHYSFTEINIDQINKLIKLIDTLISDMKLSEVYKLKGHLFSENYYKELTDDLRNLEYRSLQCLETLRNGSL